MAQDEGDSSGRRGGAARPAGRPARNDDDDPVLPAVTRDESGDDWGDEPGRRSDEWYRRERPPHHE